MAPILRCHRASQNQRLPPVLGKQPCPPRLLRRQCSASRTSVSTNSRCLLIFVANWLARRVTPSRASRVSRERILSLSMETRTIARTRFARLKVCDHDVGICKFYILINCFLGTGPNVEKALALIRKRFPLSIFPNLTMESLSVLHSSPPPPPAPVVSLSQSCQVWFICASLLCCLTF